VLTKVKGSREMRREWWAPRPSFLSELKLRPPKPWWPLRDGFTAGLKPRPPRSLVWELRLFTRDTIRAP
jgi:hypothetical protein